MVLSDPNPPITTDFLPFQRGAAAAAFVGFTPEYADSDPAAGGRTAPAQHGRTSGETLRVDRAFFDASRTSKADVPDDL